MASALSEGFLLALVKGEKIGYKPILQMLGRRNTSSIYQMPFLISDGSHTSYAVLSDQLYRELIDERGEFEDFSVFSLDKHSYCYESCGRKLLTMLDLTLLKSGSKIGRKLGHPKPVERERIGSRSNNLIYVPSDDEPAVTQSEKPDREETRRKIQKTTNVVGGDGMESFLEKILTEGTIEAFTKGEEVKYKPILQVLGYTKIPGVNSERYRMVLSDGKHSHSLAMLSLELNHKLSLGILDNFAVVRIEKHSCDQVKGDKRLLIILDLMVLRAGSLIGKMIGNPTSVFDASFTLETITKPIQVEVHENYNPILQLLAYNMIPSRGSDEQCVLVGLSDGKHAHSFSMLSSRLNDGLLSGELGLYSVIRIEKFTSAKFQSNMLRIVILEFTVLRSGAATGRVMGNPEPLSPLQIKPILQLDEGDSDIEIDIETVCDSQNVNLSEGGIMKLLCPVSKVLLSEGCIAALMNGEELSYKPILQILGFNKMPRGSPDRFRVLVSDGKHSHSLAMLATQRSMMNELGDFTVARIEKHHCSQVQGGKIMLIILDITVLHPGNLVGRVLGHPLPLFNDLALSGLQTTEANVSSS